MSEQSELMATPDPDDEFFNGGIGTQRGEAPTPTRSPSFPRPEPPPCGPTSC
jgi:hypothetical protein